MGSPGADDGTPKVAERDPRSRRREKIRTLMKSSMKDEAGTPSVVFTLAARWATSSVVRGTNELSTIGKRSPDPSKPLSTLCNSSKFERKKGKECLYAL